MGLLDRIRGTLPEQRYSADTYLSEYVMPFQYGGHTYGVPGANGLVQTLAGNRASEIVRTLPGYAAALRQCPPAFAAQNVRATVLSQARFAFRNKKTKKVFTNTALEPLETPWTNSGTGELIARMEWHAGLAGNAYVLRQPKRLRVLRPDWVAVVYGSQQEPEDAAQALDGTLLGYVYQNGGLWSDTHNPTPLLPENVAHWSPIPDPEHAGVGQSWITPAIRDMQQDRMAGEHTIRFFENGATPNLVVKGIPAATAEQFNALVAMMEEKHAGLANAYKTLYLTAGADATIVGANLAELDLKSVHGAAETRIASLSRVHPVILGIAEGLAGSSLNAGNFGMARRIWADTWIYPTLQDLASSLATIIAVPRDAELWFDARDIPLLREDGKDAAEIDSTKASTIVSLSTGGFTRKSAVAAVTSQDMTLLEEDPNWVSVQLQQSTGQAPVPKTAGLPAKPRPTRGLRHLPGKHNQMSHAHGGGSDDGGRGMPASVVSTPVASGRGTVSRQPGGNARLSVGDRHVELDRHDIERFRDVTFDARAGDTHSAGGDGVYRVRRHTRAGDGVRTENLVSLRPVPGRYVSESGVSGDLDDLPADEEAYFAEYDLVVDEDDRAFEENPSVRVRFADLDPDESRAGIYGTLLRASAAARVDGGAGPIDVYVPRNGRVGFRMKGDDGEPVEVEFGSKDIRRIHAAVEQVQDEPGTVTVDTAAGPVEVTFTEHGTLTISPPSGGPWGIAASGDGVPDLLAAFTGNATAAGIFN